MAATSFVKLNATSSQWIAQQPFNQRTGSASFPPSRRVSVVRAGSYSDELIKTAKTIASPGRGILAIDESNATCGKRLASIGLDNTEVNRQAYRQLLLTTPGLGEYISGAIMFEETLYQSTTDGKKMVDCLIEQNIVPGIKVDKGLVPLPGSNNESWCQGLDGLASRSAEYYNQGARFAKWRTVVSIPCGPSALAVKEAAWGLARYAAISQDNGLVPIVEPEILLDGDHSIDRTLEVAEKVWSEVFYYLAQNNVMFEGILLKPSMVTPGAEHKEKASPETIAKYTLTMLKRRVPPAVPGIMAKRTLGLFTLAHWDKDKWHPLLGQWLFVQVPTLCIVSLTIELNTFFLKFCPGIPPGNPRRIGWSLVVANSNIPTIHEYNSYLRDSYQKTGEKVGELC